MQTAQLLREISPPPDAPVLGMRDIGVAAAREGSRFVWHKYAGDDSPPSLAEELQLPGKAQPIPARLYHAPSDDWRSLPLVVFLHGGGWVMGDLDCYDLFMRDLCARSGANLLSVEYRLAPEHKFPAGLEDGIAAVKWAAAFTRAHANGNGAARLAVMGESAGGNLATVIARQLHAEGRIRLAAQFLLYPTLDMHSPHVTYPSRMIFGNGEYLLTRESIETTTQCYLDPTGRSGDPDVSPVLAEDLRGLPETVLVIGGYDPLLDEARTYARRLLAAGVATHFKCFETTIHAFLSFGVLDVAVQGRDYLAGEIKRCLFKRANDG